jgi:hypothetical protein
MQRNRVKNLGYALEKWDYSVKLEWAVMYTA